jgi:hypothetical protein
MSQAAAFAVLGYDCGGIKEHVYATGFASNGYPAGDAHLETTCSAGGKGGHSTTIKAWGSATWTWYGVTRSYGKLASEPVVSTTFSATDSHGDHVYNTATAAYLETTSPPVMAPAAPTGVSAYAYRTGEEGESGPQDFTVGWTPAQETAALITSSTITATPVGSSAPVVTKTITGTGSGTVIGYVEPNTTYKITVVSTDEEGTSEASAPYEAKTLTTVAEEKVPPIVITEAASAVTHTSATLNGDVNPAGEPTSICQFEYGTSESYGTIVPCTSLPGGGETPVPVSAPITGLLENMTYHYRLMATGEGGTTYGRDQTFITAPTGLTAFTEEATEVTQTSAALNGFVNPDGQEVTSCEFEYGPTESYGSAAACTSLPGAGTSPVPVSALLIALTPNSTYHFRIVAVNPAGTGYGTDQVFTTPPPVETHPTPSLKKLSPKSGAAGGGTSVTIGGSGFTGATAVRFGSTEGVIVRINSDTSMTVLSPPGAGTVDVTVAGPGGTTATSAKDHFKYKRPKH